MTSDPGDIVPSLNNQQLRRLLRDSFAIFQETLTNYEALKSNASDHKAMRLIAQRMNGFQGSFGFLPDDNEHKFNIRELAELAELICDHYSTTEGTIPENELEMVNQSLKLLEEVMISLKEQKPVPDSTCNGISILLMQGTDLQFKEKEKMSQFDIDSLLDDLL